MLSGVYRHFSALSGVLAGPIALVWPSQFRILNNSHEIPSQDGQQSSVGLRVDKTQQLRVNQGTLSHGLHSHVLLTNFSHVRYPAVSTTCIYGLKPQRNLVGNNQWNDRMVCLDVECSGRPSTNIENYKIIRAKARHSITTTQRQSWCTYVSKINSRTPIKRSGL